MRTEALALVLAASGALAQEAKTPTWLELGLHGEATLVGLTWGARAELLFRLGPEGTASRLRLSVGVLGGPDQLFIPVSLGWRAVYRQHATVRPIFGAGLELQNRLATGHDIVRLYGAYLEGGVGFALAGGRFTVGALAGLDVMLFGGPGVGLGPRVFVTWRPP